MYFWVLGTSPNTGKRALIGPYSDETKAGEAGEQLTEPETFNLETRDPSKASRIIKAKLLQRGEGIDKSMGKQLHTKGLRREGTKFPSPMNVMSNRNTGVFEGNPFEE